MKVTLFVPTLNEVEGMRVIMPRVRREWIDEILVVDGGSSDGTLDYCREQGYRVLVQKEPGLGAAYWLCFDEAIGDVIVAFSPDNNSVPELIPKLIDEIRNGHDLVIASRYTGGAKSEDDDLVTAFGNWMFTRLANILHGTRYTDFLVMYRAFRKDLVHSLRLTRSATQWCEQELMIRTVKNGYKVKDIPGDEPRRIGGQRKMRVWYNGAIVLYALLKELFVPRLADARDRRTTG